MYVEFQRGLVWNRPLLNLESANIPCSMQLELYLKKKYVCKIPSRRLKHFRIILRKDNKLAHLLHQVTYVTASDIKNFAINLQIYESFHISK